jgi:hypothetical protein
MKTKTGMTFLLLGLVCTWAITIAATDYDNQSCGLIVGPMNDKMYVNPADIVVVPKAIYLKTDRGFMQIEGISSDSLGIFVTDHELALGYCFTCGKFYDTKHRHICRSE